MKIISIVGARPQFIKLAPLAKELSNYFEHKIIHTGQHFEDNMSKKFFIDLAIPQPDYNLGINGGTHGELTGRMIIELEKILLTEKPNIVIIYGDTNSTLAGAIAASKLQIKIIHIEAGLRSFNKEMPEEINRIVADHVSDYLFAPTNIAYKRLFIEGLGNKTHLTGDIMVDALEFAIDKLNNMQINNNFISGSYYLLTLHRPYNVDNPILLSKIFNELGEIPINIIFPVHPRTRLVISKHKIFIPDNILLVDPVGYLDFINLQKNSLKIITDSGGVQKEAYILKKPCITLRSETEWIETVEAGWNLLINPLVEYNYFKKIENFNPAHNYVEVFGRNVAKKMLDLILKFTKRD